jgi:predicted DNA-binding transcriptional regulator AlpA
MKFQNCDLPHIGYVRLPQILAVIPISKSSWWQWVSEGKAPAPVKLGPRITAWRVEQINALIQDLGSEAQAA